MKMKGRKPGVKGTESGKFRLPVPSLSKICFDRQTKTSKFSQNAVIAEF